MVQISFGRKRVKSSYAAHGVVHMHALCCIPSVVMCFFYAMTELRSS